MIERNEEAVRNVRLATEFNTRASRWLESAVVYWRMYHTDQWEQAERDFYFKKKRYPLQINICAPVIDGFVSMLIGNNPRFKASPARMHPMDGTKATLADFVLEYVFDRSYGTRELAQAVLDYAVDGLGAMIADIDRSADFGEGEVEIRSLRWSRVKWDLAARRPGFKDARWVMVEGRRTATELIGQYPEHRAVIEEVARDRNDDASLGITLVDTDAEYLRGSVSGSVSEIDDAIYANTVRGRPQQSRVELSGDIATGLNDISRDDWKQTPLLVLERYERVFEERWKCYDPGEHREFYLSNEDFESVMLHASIRESAYQVIMPRIRRVVTLEDALVLDDSVLPLTDFPIAFFVKMNAGTSLPIGMMNRLEDIQIEFNKRSIAILENAVATSVGRMLAPQNIIPRDEWEALIGLPNALIEYKKSLNISREHFIPLTPQSLPNQMFALHSNAMNLAQYSTGVDPVFMGMSSGMPGTYRQSLMVEDYGMRKVRAIDLSTIEAGIQQLGQVALELAQFWYTRYKVLSIVDDQGAMRQMEINAPFIDPDTGEVTGISGIRDLLFSVKIISGSTVPRNKFALLDHFLELFDRKLVDDETVLMQTGLPNVKEILQRVSALRQALQQLTQLQEMLGESQKETEKLRGALTQARIKTSAGDIIVAEKLVSLQRQMEEKLARAVTDLKMREMIKNLKEEERRITQISQLKMEQAVEIARLQAQAAFQKEKTAASK